MKMKERFTLEPYDDCDKCITITEKPANGRSLYIQIDFDDVDHDVIEKKVKKLMDVLNEHW
jgi:hypothetical protein